MKPSRDIPRPDVLIKLWRVLMTLSRRHGLFSLARLHTTLHPNGQIIALRAGGQMFVPPDSHFFGFVLDTHEPHVTEAFQRYVKAGDTCLDVGANIGYFSSLLAQLAGPTGEVLAFEPVPENYAVLQKNAAMAAARGLRITPRNVAVSSERGELKIVRKEWSTYHEVAPLTEKEKDAERVPAVALDDVIAHLPERIISMLKIDVEGHELPVVQGLSRSLEAGRIRRMVIEVTPGPDAQAIGALIHPYARTVRSWIDGEWREQPIGDVSARTDVFVEFSIDEP